MEMEYPLMMLSLQTWVLGLEESCEGEYTIHGLWPSRDFCSQVPYKNATLRPLQSDLDKWWPSYPRYHHTNEWLWRHEWTKHGTCSNMTLFDYFSKTLELRAKYYRECDQHSLDSSNCYLCFEHKENGQLSFNGKC